MSTTSRRVGVFAVLMSLVTLLAGANFVAAADPPAPLQPVPPAAIPEDFVDVESGDYEDGVYEDGVYEEDYDLSLCSPLGRVWLRADYLMWWTSGMDLPPLVTTGALGQPGTQILYGDGTVNDDGRSGYRTTIGFWLDACRVWNVEFDYLNLGERSNSYERSSTGDPILARPYYDVQNGMQACTIVASPGFSGSVSVEAADYFQTAGMLVSYNLCSSTSCAGACDGFCDSEYGGTCGDSCGVSCGVPLLYCCRTDLLAGFRYYNLSDRVEINNTTRSIELGATWDNYDSFRACNDFYGSEVGLRNQIYRGRWSLEILTKVAIGNTRQSVTVNGQTVYTPVFGAPATYGYGVLALPNPPANIGTYERDVFTVIPQLGVELGYQLNCHWRTFFGYNVLYWGAVSRAADQIDLNVDPRNMSTAPSGMPFPSYLNKTTSFWAQGINLGLERRF